tara:strand:- start:39 stop:725 length:687 start_codon:yes stop_codon:yes gene_type:complete
MIDKLVKQTIHFSLFIQVITTLVSLDGFSIKIPQQDFILKEILAIETIVQLVEGFFYTWIIFALNDLNKMTPRRYIDWTITTPIMLFSTIIFFKYNELKENGQMTNFTTYEFIQENRENMITIFIFNGLMLLCGFLGEIGVIDKRIGIPLGFVFFYKSFEIIYTEYAVKTELGKQLFNILAGLWSLYGVSAMLPLQQKNISYNMLDIVAKNFYGLYIYYKIKELRIYN